MKIAVILPTYNEKDNIAHLIPEIFAVFTEEGIDGQIIVVDDSSPDGTSEFVEDLQNRFPIILMKRKSKLGLGSAYVMGFKKALENNTDVIFEMDADLSHSPSEIPEFLEKINAGCDVVVGSRTVPGGKISGWGMTRKLVSWTGNFIGKYLAGVYVSDLTSGYRTYKKEVLEKINLDKVESSGYGFQLEMLARARDENFKIGIVPITFANRSSGSSKLSKKDLITFFIIALKIRFNFLKK